MTAAQSGGRKNQKLRTRKQLLDTAARLLAENRQPTLDEVAEAALVSRATAYRYFPNIDALLLEAALHVRAPHVDEIFDDGAGTDPVLRLQRVEQAFHDMVLANEPHLRLMLAHTLRRSVEDEAGESTPSRQNRRTPLIDAALQPARSEFTPANLERLRQAAALIIGPEAMVVCKDVLRLDDDAARKLKQWVIKALVDAARRQPRPAR